MVRHGGQLPAALQRGGGSAPDSIAIPELTLKVHGKYPSAEQQALLRTMQTEDVNVDGEDVLVLVSTYAPLIKERVPSDIVLVVDISGSMGNDATTQVRLRGRDTTSYTPHVPSQLSTPPTHHHHQGVEYSGLSLLDIVKHAVKTVIATLGDKDRLALVSYANSAKVVFDLMTMDAIGKENAGELLDRLQPGGMTNLWDGLKAGLDILKNRILPGGSTFGNNAAMMLLTDGEPNIEPPRGHIPMLKRYCDANGGRFPGIISTFGFGYQLDSVLLRQIAVHGGGMYAFIPDSGFVGTAFVNALANTLATVTTDAVLKVTVDAEMGIVLRPDAVVGGIPHTRGGDRNNVLTIPLGSVQTGQTRDVLLRLSLPRSLASTAAAGSPVGPLLSVTLQYHPNRSHTYTHSVNSALAEGKRDGGPGEGKAGGEGKGGGEGKEEEKGAELDPATTVATRGPYVHADGTVAATQSPPGPRDRTLDVQEVDYQLLKWVGINYISRCKVRARPPVCAPAPPGRTASSSTSRHANPALHPPAPGRQHRGVPCGV